MRRRSRGTSEGRASGTPSFYLTEQRGPRPGAILLAVIAAGVALVPTLMFRGRPAAQGQGEPDRPSVSRTPGATPTSEPAAEDKDDDPSQVDTIVLGDAADAPVPARKSDRVSPVHATILVRLPRYGEQVGLIPDSPAGHLLYGWLAAFNQSSSAALDAALPNVAPEFSVAAQMVLRVQTGGFSLLSAKEVQPGVMVFRLRDQTPDANEVLGTLMMRPNSNPPSIASFSLRAVPLVRKGAAAAAPPIPRDTSAMGRLRAFFSRGGAK